MIALVGVFLDFRLLFRGDLLSDLVSLLAA